MSTGLTWVTIVDPSNALVQTTPVAFSLYDEANEYAEWFVRYWWLVCGGDLSVMRVSIYTSGPGQNGQWYYDYGAVFIPFD